MSSVQIEYRLDRRINSSGKDKVFAYKVVTGDCPFECYSCASQTEHTDPVATFNPEDAPALFNALQTYLVKENLISASA